MTDENTTNEDMFDYTPDFGADDDFADTDEDLFAGMPPEPNEAPVREIAIEVAIEVKTLSLCDSGLSNDEIRQNIEEHLREVMQWEFAADDPRVHSVDADVRAEVKDVETADA